MAFNSTVTRQKINKIQRLLIWSVKASEESAGAALCCGWRPAANRKTAERALLRQRFLAEPLVWVSDEIRERDCVMKRSEICIHKKTTPADCWTAAGNFISNFSASHDAEMASASQKCWAETPTTPSGNHTHPLHHRWTFQQQLFNFKHALINSQLTVLLVRLWCWSSEGGGVRRSGGQQTHGGAGKKIRIF